MFVALELTQHGAGGIRNRIREILYRPVPEMQDAEALGRRYLLIRAPLVRGVPDWEEIAVLAGRYAGRMLLPDGVIPPEGSPIRTIQCPGFMRKVLCETVCALIDQTRMPLYRRILGFIDPDASHRDWLPQLLRHFTTIQVVTDREALYEETALEMMEKMGAPVAVRGNGALTPDCVLALAPDHTRFPRELRFSCPVMTSGSLAPLRNTDIITAPEIEASESLRLLSPEGVSPHRFAAALHEYCGLELARYRAATVRYNYQQISLAEAARLLLAAVEFPAV